MKNIFSMIFTISNDSLASRLLLVLYIRNRNFDKWTHEVRRAKRIRPDKRRYKSLNLESNWTKVMAFGSHTIFTWRFYWSIPYFFYKIMSAFLLIKAVVAVLYVFIRHMILVDWYLTSSLLWKGNNKYISHHCIAHHIGNIHVKPTYPPEKWTSFINVPIQKSNNFQI